MEVLSLVQASRSSKFWKPFSLIVVSLSLVYLAIGWLWYGSFLQRELEIEGQQELTMLNFHADGIQSEMSAISADLKILSSLSSGALKHGSLLTESSVRSLENFYASFLTARQTYDQIRFLDLNGNERVRVNRLADGSADIVKPDLLQNKANRYYFSESLGLHPNEIFMSRLDLNIEHGMIEIPFKPMLRFGLMIYSPDSHGVTHPIGVVVINYLAQNIINLLHHQQIHPLIMTLPHAHFDLSMIDSLGYWLMSDTKERNWGFMFDLPQTRVSVQDPDLWKAMQEKKVGMYKSGSFYTFFNFVNVKDIDINFGVDENWKIKLSRSAGEDYGWFVVNQRVRSDFSQIAVQKIEENAFLLVTIYGLLVLLSYLISLFWMARQAAHEQAYHMAYHDGLTGVYNRAAWIDLIRPELEERIEGSKTFAVAYVDLNDFKPVNDTYGHDVGDEVLKIAAKRLTGSVREDDYVIRLGGDEFLVIFSELHSVSDYKYLLQKLSVAFVKPLAIMNFNIPLSVSIGVATYPVDADNLSALTEIADNRMYEMKEGDKMQKEQEEGGYSAKTFSKTKTALQ